MTQRNSLLKRIKEGYAKPDDLDIWDEQLAEQGSIIIKERVSSISFINERLTATYQNISKGDEKVHANYKSILTEGVKINPDTAPSNSLPNEQNSLSLGQIKDSFLNKLQTSRQRDLQAEFTTTGPHRDDIEFLLNDLPLIRHASRGEYRSLLMALKLVELSFYEQNSKQKPLLLLDDVFSELDPTRQKTLIDAIKDYQTILTSTHSPVDMTSYEKNVIILHDGITEPEKQIKK